MNKPSVLFFDASGTLFRLPRGVGWHYADVASRHGLALDASAVDVAFRAAWRVAPAARESDGPRADDDRDWWRTLVSRVLAEVRVPAEFDRAAYFEELWVEFARPGVWELYPEVAEVLSALGAQGFRLGVISNFDSRLRAILGHLGVAGFFDPIVVSSEAGVDKPAARIFHHACRLAGVAPGEALHTGDEPEADWRGAAEAGLRAFHLDRPRNSLRDLLVMLGIQ